MVQKLAGHPLIAKTTATVPHPYEDGMAEEWIGKHAEWFANGTAVQFAITLKSTRELIGCIDIFEISKTNQKGEMGYWIGTEQWNKGYCTEAAQAVLRFAFLELSLNRVSARHLDMNPASGHVMRKIGMKSEGRLREDRFKNGRFADLELFAILRSEYAGE